MVTTNLAVLAHSCKNYIQSKPNVISTTDCQYCGYKHKDVYRYFLVCGQYMAKYYFKNFKTYYKGFYSIANCYRSKSNGN